MNAETNTMTTQKKPEFQTGLTRVNDLFMPLILKQMQKNNIQMTPYAKECALHAISAINGVLDKSGLTWNSSELDKSTVSDILIKIACFQLNAAASPREVYFQLRNVKSAQKDQNGRDVWKKQVEMGIEGDGNDALLARFGRDVVAVNQIWKVREGDDFSYPSFDGMNMTPPRWTPKGQGKIVKIVYPVVKAGPDGKNYVEFYIAERADVIRNLIAHINSNLMNETFGICKDRYHATAEQKAQIDARKKELLKKAGDEGLDAALDDPELQPWISPAWTEFHSRESMIERKMRNNAIKKIPKDFGNRAMETMFEEATDETYRMISAEVHDSTASLPLEIDPPEEPQPVPSGPQEPQEEPQAVPKEEAPEPQETEAEDVFDPGY